MDVSCIHKQHIAKHTHGRNKTHILYIRQTPTATCSLIDIGESCMRRRKKDTRCAYEHDRGEQFEQAAVIQAMPLPCKE